MDRNEGGQWPGGPGGERGVKMIIYLVAAGIVGAVLLVFWLWLGQRPETGPGSGGVVPAGEHLQWDSTGQPPAVVSIGGGGREDLIGRYNVLERGVRSLYVGAFDGKTFQRLWSSPPLGASESAYLRVLFAVAGSRVLVTDANMKAHVLELASGQEVAALPLSDHAKAICPAPGGAAQVWLELADGKSVLINLQDAAAMPAPRPDWCTEPIAAVSARLHRPRAGALPAEQAPGVEGFHAERVLRDGEIAVAVGVRAPGTATPVLAGFEPGAQAVRWQSPLGGADRSAVKEGAPAMVDLRDGRVIAAYELTAGGWRLAALDAGSGNTLWDVELPRSRRGDGSAPEGLVVSASRVYVPHWTWLDVFDVRTGALVGTVGVW